MSKDKVDHKFWIDKIPKTKNIWTLPPVYTLTVDFNENGSFSFSGPEKDISLLHDFLGFMLTDGCGIDVKNEM